MVIGLREISLSDIARCGLSARANLLLSRANSYLGLRQGDLTSCQDLCGRLASDQRRITSPAFKSMVEGGRALIAQQPSDLGKGHAWILEILERQTAAQLVCDLLVGRSLDIEPAREVRVLMPSALATVCLCALPCGRSFSTSFSTAARSVSDAVLRSFAAISQKGSSALSSFGSEVRRGAATAAFENSSRSDQTPSSTARPNSTGQPKKRSYSGRSAFRACANAARIGRMLRPQARAGRHNDRYQELGPLSAQRPRQTDETDFDDKAVRRCSPFHARSFVGDPGIAVKKRQGFAEVFCGGHDIEDDPHIMRIGLLGQVKTECGVLDRLCSAIEEPALSHRRYAMVEGAALHQVALRDACVAQHRGSRDVTPPQGVDRLLGRKPHRCRQAPQARVLGQVNAPVVRT